MIILTGKYAYPLRGYMMYIVSSPRKDSFFLREFSKPNPAWFKTDLGEFPEPPPLAKERTLPDWIEKWRIK